MPLQEFGDEAAEVAGRDLRQPALYGFVALQAAQQLEFRREARRIGEQIGVVAQQELDAGRPRGLDAQARRGA